MIEKLYLNQIRSFGLYLLGNYLGLSLDLIMKLISLAIMVAQFRLKLRHLALQLPDLLLQLLVIS